MDKALELHKALVEAAAENDEGLMEKFFESESLTEDEMREWLCCEKQFWKSNKYSVGEIISGGFHKRWGNKKVCISLHKT